MSKKFSILLGLICFFQNISAQNLANVNRQSVKAVTLMLEAQPIEASKLRELVSQVDFADYAQFADFTFRRSGKFADCITIENPYTALKSVEISETVLLYFIQLLEQKQAAKRRPSSRFAEVRNTSVNYLTNR